MTKPRSYLAGLIGGEIQASRSPAMHEEGAAAMGLRYVYRLLDLEVLGMGVADLPELIA